MKLGHTFQWTDFRLPHRTTLQWTDTVLTAIDSAEDGKRGGDSHSNELVQKNLQPHVPVILYVHSGTIHSHTFRFHCT